MIFITNLLFLHFLFHLIPFFFLIVNMIKISYNKAYDFLRPELTEIYTSYSIEPQTLIENIYKSEHYYKQLTSLIFNYENLIDSEHISIFKKAISYIGKCFHLISENVDKININLWNNDEIIYDISEFKTYDKSKRFNKVQIKDIINKAFSKNNLRYICIKAEILIYTLFILLSNYHEKNEDEYLILFGGINYALIKSKTLIRKNNEINTMARYVWELSSLFNLTLLHEYEIANYIPLHNLFNHEQILMNAEYFGLSWESEDIEISSQLQFPIKLKFSQCTSNNHNCSFELQIDDEMQYDIITEYTENYKNIIRTIKILINSDNISIPKIITTLAYITKTEQKHITIVQ